MHKQDETEDATKVKRPKGEQGVQMKQGMLHGRRKITDDGSGKGS